MDVCHRLTFRLKKKETMMRKLGLVMALLLVACGEAPPAPQFTEEQGSVADLLDAASTSAFYTIRRDERRCAWPLCGGYWVTRVNRAKTLCADGRLAPRCYIVDLDWSNTDLTEQERMFGDNPVLLHGTLSLADFDNNMLGILTVDELWRAAAGNNPRGVFYVLGASNVQCIRDPCPTFINAYRLNSDASRAINRLSGRFGAEVQALLSQEKIIVAGSIYETAHRGDRLAVNQYYRRAMHEQSDLDCNSDAECTTSAYTHSISSSDECYCARCANTIMNLRAEAFYRASWEAHCSEVDLICIAIACDLPPATKCENHQCVRASDY
jgi:hypothetical protein